MIIFTSKWRRWIEWANEQTNERAYESQAEEKKKKKICFEIMRYVRSGAHYSVLKCSGKGTRFEWVWRSSIGSCLMSDIQLLCLLSDKALFPFFMFYYYRIVHRRQATHPNSSYMQHWPTKFRPGGQLVSEPQTTNAITSSVCCSQTLDKRVALCNYYFDCRFRTTISKQDNISLSFLSAMLSSVTLVSFRINSTVAASAAVAVRDGPATDYHSPNDNTLRSE